jgi:hypothetical protein
MKIKYEIDIPFRYKGKRNYVHGPDIYNSVLRAVRDLLNVYPARINGSFHRLLRNNGICTIQKDIDQTNREGAYAIFSMKIKEEIFHASVYDAGTKISSSYSYDEKKVLEGVIVEDDEIRMVAKKRCSYMEELVAMTKKLHLSLYPNAIGKWLVTKIMIEHVVDPNSYWGHVLAVKSERNFHNRLTQCSISLDAKRLGVINFSLFPGDEVS